MKAKVGDWIRFYNGGHLVIEEVLYVQQLDRVYPRHEIYVTNRCPVDEPHVIEVRSKQ